MRPSRRVRYLLILGLILLNLLIRLPQHFHEFGIDSFFIHSLSGSIENNADANFLLDPLAAFGLFPFSYPSANPVMISSISSLTGLGLESSILLFSMVLGVISVAAGYLLGSEIKDDFRFKYLVAFFISTSPLFVRSTIWQASSRNLFVVGLTILFWVILKYRHAYDKRPYYALIPLVIFLLSVTHRMFMLLPLIMVAYALTQGILWLYRRMDLQFLPEKQLNLLKIGALAVWGLAIMGLLYAQVEKMWIYSDYNFSEAFLEGAVFSGDSKHVIFLNMGVHYVSSVSLLSFFALVGIFYWRKRFRADYIILFLLSLLFLSSLLTVGTYMDYMFIVPMAIFSAEGFTLILDKWPLIRKNAGIASVLFLLVSTGFTVFMIDHWNDMDTSEGTQRWINEDTINGAMVIRRACRTNETFVCNDPVIGMRISAFSQRPVFERYGHVLSAYGIIEEEDLDIEPIKASDISPNLDLLYKVKKPKTSQDYNRLVTNNPKSDLVKGILQKYETRFIVVNNNLPNEVQIGGTVSSSKFYSKVDDIAIRIYSNDLLSIYRIIV